MDHQHTRGEPTTSSDPARVVALLWHGRGPHESDVLGPLAAALADNGHVPVVPGWDPGAADGGRSDLMRSLASAHDEARARGLPLIVAGWSLGGTAALSLALAGVADAGRVEAVVGLAPDVSALSPVTRAPLPAGREPSMPVVLAHGIQDPIVPVDDVIEFHRGRQHDSRCRIQLVDTDHAGIIGAVYDPERQRCVRGTIPAARRGLDAAVAAVDDAAAALHPRGSGSVRPTA